MLPYGIDFSNIQGINHWSLCRCVPAQHVGVELILSTPKKTLLAFEQAKKMGELVSR